MKGKGILDVAKTRIML